MYFSPNFLFYITFMSRYKHVKLVCQLLCHGSSHSYFKQLRKRIYFEISFLQGDHILFMDGTLCCELRVFPWQRIALLYHNINFHLLYGICDSTSPVHTLLHIVPVKGDTSKASWNLMKAC